ncbi:UPF0746 protein DDB_G0281095-like isoform X2 [Erinaceus europaeus]|uniref:UPF0746 protein DDB_G0281095-like isoform X2 n=1 Tax=Erinaceus europaeus TaxID=9365 RepID=A0ABM3WP77_ERIEU|nr:UPF0746 protein DDB_G0281095-like isoform X2 [Erinaceus europaeus]
MGPPRYSPLCREEKALGIMGHWSLTPPLVKWTVGLVGLILLVFVLVFGIKAFSPCPQEQCVGTSQPDAWSPTLVKLKETLEKEEQNLQKEKQHLEEETQNLQKEKQQLQEERQNLQKEKQRQEEETQNLQKEKQQLQKEKQQLQEEKQNLQKEKQRQEEKQNLQKEKQQLQVEKQNLQKEKQQLQVEKQQLQVEKQNLQKEKQQLQEQLQSLGRREEEHERRDEILTSQLGQCNEDLNQLRLKESSEGDHGLPAWGWAIIVLGALALLFLVCK